MATDDPNPYLHVAAAPEPRRAAVDKLSTTECWRLLARGELGRLAVTGIDGSPDVFPVNYLVHSGALYIRSAPGAKLIDITAHREVAFEVDGENAASRWSVVIRGNAHRLDTDAEIEESGILHLTSWSPTGKHNYIRITATSVTGRRFRRRFPDIAPPVTVPLGAEGGTAGRRPTSPGASTEGRAQRPIRIPHVRPLPEE